jgi:OOP family OmpA-OmpF porin
MNKKNIIIILIILALLFFIYKKFFNKDKEEKIFKDAFDNLQFETGNAIIKDFSKPYLDELANVLNSVNWSLSIIGHTDNVGSEADNLILSKKRADAVKNYLVSKGIADVRINTIGKGESEPIVSNETAQGREKNRRVEFIIIK